MLQTVKLGSDVSFAAMPRETAHVCTLIAREGRVAEDQPARGVHALATRPRNFA
jgi:hypothetical protein